MTNRFWRIIAFSLPLLLAWVLYAYALTLPFFGDDAPHYRFLLGVDGIVPLWLGQTWSPYYRPVVYTVWVIMRTLQGEFNPLWQHAFNVWLFAFSGVFVSLIVQRLLRRRYLWVSVLAGCAFVMFPFHYQAVNLVGSLTHLAVSFSLLLALLMGIRAYLTSHKGALVLCWLFAMLANFSHETGFLVAPFLLGTLFLLDGMRLRWRKALGVVLVPALVSAFYLVLWLRLPRVGTEGGFSLSVSPLDNLGVMLQPFVYPLSALLRPFFEGKGDPLLLVMLFLGAVLAGLGMVFLRSRALMLTALAGVAWYLITIVPSVLVLAPNYVWSSPRLAVLASVGAIVFWACVGVSLYKGRVSRVVMGISLLIIVALNFSFLLARRNDYMLMRDYTQELMHLVEQERVNEEGVLLINAPNYIEPFQNDKTFLVGAEFTSFMSPEIAYADYFAVNTEQDYRNASIDVIGVGRVIQSPNRQFVPYFPLVDGEELIAHLRQERPIILTQFEGERFYPVLVRGGNDVSLVAPQAEFEGVLQLLNVQATLNPETMRLNVITDWQALSVNDVKLFVHVVCDGVLIAQSDGYVWGNLYPFVLWQTDEIQRDRRVISLEGVDFRHPDCVNVWVGVYREANGQRLEARRLADNTRYTGDAVPFGVELLREYTKP